MPRRRRSRAPRVLAILVALALVVGVAGYVVLGRRSSGPSYPKQWDPRVTTIVSFVERERGMKFERPVYVDFLSAADYRTATQAGDGQSAAAARREEAQAVGTLRAIGLLSGKVDLAAATKELADTGTLAFYSTDDKRIRVRGTAMTTSLRVTLAHELTHALQDQYFDLTRFEDLPEPQSTTAQAVIEGDASRIEDAYVQRSLSSAERKAYERQSNAESDQASSKLAAKVPDVLQTAFALPYALGPQLVQIVDVNGGKTAVDDLIRRPPRSEEQLLNPFAYLDGDEPEKVGAVTVPKGAKVFDRTPLGASLLYLLLADRIDPQQALAAADGWGGDASALYDYRGKVCVAVDLRGEDQAATDRLATNLTSWAATLPRQAGATIDRRGGVVRLRSCDPGAGVRFKVGGRTQQMLALPAIRAELGFEALRDGQLSNESARCVAERAVRVLDLKALSLDTPSDDPRFQAAIEAAMAVC
ncbi:MAG: hypothetical protein HYX34_00860 [Actinobacteria bacterium]|nr:hypothetical protein [Actinomycetota bacterium]